MSKKISSEFQPILYPDVVHRALNVEGVAIGQIITTLAQLEAFLAEYNTNEKKYYDLYQRNAPQSYHDRKAFEKRMEQNEHYPHDKFISPETETVYLGFVETNNPDSTDVLYYSHVHIILRMLAQDSK